MTMEGNTLGPKTANEFGLALASNTGLIHLDLQANLLSGEKETYGFESLCEALKTNTTLLSLNLNNCGLEPECGKTLLNCIQSNKSIISIDYGENDFDQQTSAEIQEHLNGNLEAF